MVSNGDGSNNLKLNLIKTDTEEQHKQHQDSMVKLTIDELEYKLVASLQNNPQLEDEIRIIETTNKIDEQILMLDNRMDLVLEQHEKDFLSAYRKHMIEVQNELTDLKAKGTDAELQLK